MTQEQFKKASNVVFLVLLIITGYTMLSLVAFFLVAETVEFTSYAQLIAAIIAFVGNIILYVKCRGTKLGGNGMVYLSLGMYLVLRLCANVEDSGMYIFPIIMAAMAFLDSNLIKIANAVALVANIGRLIIRFEYINDASGGTMVVMVFVCVLVAIASIRITKLLVLFNEENMGVIVETAKKQEESNKVMVTVADNITKHFADATEMFESLENSMDSSHSSMKDIADSSESTAEAIQSEARVCSEIRIQTDQADEITVSMMQASNKVKETVTSGSKSVHELRMQAKNVSSSSQIVEDVINELTQKVKEVESFVETILSISSQTNLLALNASIEAARAGEAGRGFSVVAEEIRKLSEDTKDASNNITDIIQVLNVDTKRANESIGEAVASVTKQNGLIEETENNFAQVEDEINTLLHDIEATKNVMGAIVESSNLIYDNITQLSASSQEVVASAEEGLNNSHNTVTQVKRCKEIFDAIHLLAQDLKQR